MRQYIDARNWPLNHAANTVKANTCSSLSDHAGCGTKDLGHKLSTGKNAATNVKINRIAPAICQRRVYRNGSMLLVSDNRDTDNVGAARRVKAESLFWNI